MNFRSLAIRIGLAALILGVAWVLRNFVRSMIAVPLLEALWWLKLYLQATPPWFYWALFIILAYLIAMGSLRTPSSGSAKKGKSNQAHQQRIRQLATWIGRADSAYYQHRLNHTISNLAAGLMAQSRRQPMTQIRQELADGKVACPANVQVYLQAGLPVWPENPPSKLTGWLNGTQGRGVNNNEIDQVTQVLDYLEHEFGGFHDA